MTSGSGHETPVEHDDDHDEHDDESESNMTSSDDESIENFNFQAAICLQHKKQT